MNSGLCLDTRSSSCLSNAAGELYVQCSDPSHYFGQLVSVVKGNAESLQSCTGKSGAQKCRLVGLLSVSHYRITCAPPCGMSTIIFDVPIPTAIVGSVMCVAVESVINFDAWCNTGGKSLITGFGVVGRLLPPSACRCSC